MGKRTISAHEVALQKFGVKIETENGQYVISVDKKQPENVVMYEMSDTATENALLAAAMTKGKTTTK